MLVITRKIQEKMIIGEDVVITILRVTGNQVRLGIEAPKEIEVNREEVYSLKKQVKKNNRFDPLTQPAIH